MQYDRSKSNFKSVFENRNLNIYLINLNCNLKINLKNNVTSNLKIILK